MKIHALHHPSVPRVQPPYAVKSLQYVTRYSTIDRLFNVNCQHDGRPSRQALYQVIDHHSPYPVF